MKTLIRGIALAIAVLAMGHQKGMAQVMSFTGPAGTVPVLDAAPTDRYVLAPYSYYTAMPYPARGYVGFGNNDFPYYGHPYGSPSDRWTWAYMSDAYYGTLAHYYYVPLK